MKLEIVTPLGKIFAGNIKEVTLPGSEGEFGVLENHTPVVSTLKAGVIDIVKEDGKKDVVAINWGYVDVSPKCVNVLVDEAVAVAGMDDSEIANNLAAASKLMEDFAECNVALAYVKGKMESAAKSIH